MKMYTKTYVLLLIIGLMFGCTYKTSHAQSYSCTDIKVNLKQGSRGSDVKKLQDFLIITGYLQGKADGMFGYKTKVAVSAYQKNRKIIPASGFFGPITRAKLENESCQIIDDTASVSTFNKIYVFPTFINFTYAIGESSYVPDQQILINNKGYADMHVDVQINNKPSWLKTEYLKNTLIAHPNDLLKLDISVNPSGLSVGTYSTTVTLSGDFYDSPKSIPVVLKVYASKQDAFMGTINDQMSGN
jgi:Putative peptidoglycan binding domain